MTFSIILFAITYILMLAFSKYRTLIALVSAMGFIVSGMLPLNQIISSIDFNVLLMIAGTMGLLFGLFLIIGGITNMGVIDAVANLLSELSGGNMFYCIR